MKTPLVILTSFALSSLAFAESQNLFNGKDLTGWDGSPNFWTVEDGCITGKTAETPGTPEKSNLRHNTFLVWKDGTVGDFELHFKYRILSNWANSGLQYRSKVVQQGPDGPIVRGYQADLESGPSYSGILYEEGGRGILASRGQKVEVQPDPSDANKSKISVTGALGNPKELQENIKAKDWNEYVVIAKGNHLQHFINGKQTIDVTDNHPKSASPEGIIAFQLHGGPPMTIQFKDITLERSK